MEVLATPSTAIGETDARFLLFVPSPLDNTVVLPPLQTQRAGGPRFYIANTSVFSLIVKRNDGTTLTTVAFSQAIALVVGSTDWAIKTYALSSGATS